MSTATSTDNHDHAVTDVLSTSDERDVAELLKTLDSANGLAGGLENRLDSLLDNLDNLLAVLEQRRPPDHDPGQSATKRSAPS